MKQIVVFTLFFFHISLLAERGTVRIKQSVLKNVHFEQHGKKIYIYKDAWSKPIIVDKSMVETSSVQKDNVKYHAISSSTEARNRIIAILETGDTSQKAQNQFDEAVEYLQQKQSNLDFELVVDGIQMNVLFYSIYSGQTEYTLKILRSGLKAGINEQAVYDKRGIYYRISPVSYAIIKGQVLVLQEMKKHAETNWNCQDQYRRNSKYHVTGITPLFTAINENKPQIAKFLIEIPGIYHNRKTIYKNKNKTVMTPILLAIKKGQKKIAQLLYEKIKAKLEDGEQIRIQTYSQEYRQTR
ncbi:MAG: ankyrin repeat domain-containing protein [Spirochaetota bacterium]